MNEPTDPLDPELLESLKDLAHYPPRDPRRQAEGRAKFLAAARAARARRRFGPRLLVDEFARILHTWLAPLLPASLPGNLRAASLAAILILILFGGSAMTVFAAKSSLPGDALYAVKTAVEDARLTFSVDAAAQARLHMQFAQRRLDEISSLIAQNRLNGVGQAADLFAYHVKEARQNLQQVTAADPAKGQALEESLATSLKDNSTRLNDLRAQAPQNAAPALEQALNASQFTPAPAQAEQASPTPTPSPSQEPAQATFTLAPPTETPTPQTPTANPVTLTPSAQAGDLDVVQFDVSQAVNLLLGDEVEITIELAGAGAAAVTVTGEQGGVEIYRETRDAPPPGENGSTLVEFPAYTPTAAGEIRWKVTLADADPDTDEATASTAVLALTPTPGQATLYRLRVSRQVSLKKAAQVEIAAVVDFPAGSSQGLTVTVVGVQNGVEVYRQVQEVPAGAGPGRIAFDFPPFKPTAGGEITWTAALGGGEPVKGKTRVNP